MLRTVVNGFIFSPFIYNPCFDPTQDPGPIHRRRSTNCVKPQKFPVRLRESSQLSLLSRISSFSPDSQFASNWATSQNQGSATYAFPEDIWRYTVFAVAIQYNLDLHTVVSPKLHHDTGRKNWCSLGKVMQFRLDYCTFFLPYSYRIKLRVLLLSNFEKVVLPTPCRSHKLELCWVLWGAGQD